MTWTPGPWQVHDGGHPFPQICGVWPNDNCRPVAEMNGEEEHAKANARLISLAPEMAEFLADLVIPVPADAAWTIDFDHARALLRRARGEDA